MHHHLSCLLRCHLLFRLHPITIYQTVSCHGRNPGGTNKLNNNCISRICACCSVIDGHILPNVWSFNLGFFPFIDSSFCSNDQMEKVMISLLNVNISVCSIFYVSVGMSEIYLFFCLFVLLMQYILKSLKFSAWTSSPACDDLHPTSSGGCKDFFPPLENAASAATGACASSII